ncbi:MAG TPA: hydroxyacylglutathione hydrolase [Myxococcales bacterium]|nr:hydroxyacylglutathione hydrolase [Myxococcales bacterium]HAN30512.1 hydroxyacylglutathione hydrolase [Myxococcales bacterium]
MRHVVTITHRPFQIAAGKLVVHQVPLHQDNLGWVLVHPTTSQCYLVDGTDAGPYLSLIQARGWTLRGVLITHTHPDHIGVVKDLDNRGLLDELQVIGFEGRSAEIPGLTRGVGEGDELDILGAKARVWLTEGHIDGHICFVFDGAVFCGDTMFGGGCGYLFDGPAATMFESLGRLAALPDDTRVCCGHEYTADNLWFASTVNPSNRALQRRVERARELRRKGHALVPSTIELERQTNPFLVTHGRAELCASVHLPESTASAEVFASLRRLKDSKDYKRQPNPVAI